MNLEDKTLAELVALHNDLNPEHPIRKFRDKPTAVARVEALFEAIDTLPTAFSPNAHADVEMAIEVAAKPKRRGYTFDAKVGEVSWPQEGCKRYRLAKHMLSLGNSGATFDALHAWAQEQGFGWKRNDLADAIRLLIRKNGFGFTTTSTGLIAAHNE